MVVLLAALSGPGCGSGERVRQGSPSGGDAAQLLGPEEFAAEVAKPSTFTLNVHVPDEGSLPGTDRSIPFDRLWARRSDLPPEATTIAVYCRSGTMSTTAQRQLREMGYGRVVELRGGMLAWRAAGRHLLPPRT